MSDFFKDPGDLGSLNLSDISDVDPDELEKIVRSAGELDKKYFGLDSSKDKPEAKDKKEPPGISTGEKKGITDDDDILKRETSFSGKSGPANLIKSTENPIGYSLDIGKEDEEKVEKRGRSSADWLGLKDSPIKQPSFDADDYMRLKTGTSIPQPETFFKSSRRNSLTSSIVEPTSSSPIHNLKTNDTRKKELGKSSVDETAYKPPIPGESPLRMSLRHKSAQVNKNKGKLIDELFGEAKLAGDDSFKIGIGPDSNESKTEDQTSKGVGYMPSASAGKRLERRRETSAQGPSAAKLDSDFDWLMGTRPSTGRKPNQNEIGQASILPQTKMSPGTPLKEAPIPTSRTMTKKESKIPDWMEGIIPDSSVKDDNIDVSSGATVRSQSQKLPTWLGGSDPANETQMPSENVQQTPNVQVPVAAQETLTKPIQAEPVPNTLPNTFLPSITFTNDPPSDIVNKLASIQKELGDAIAQRNKNLQIYMQVLMIEAQRVWNLPNIASNLYPNNLTKNKNEDDNEDGYVDKKDEIINKKDELIKHQEDLIHDFEINISKLELQNNQLEMKIESIKSMHEMEIETLKKNHGFEISAWETRLERTKTSFDETIEDYKNKIAKLKENEESLIAEHIDRISKLEEERLADLEKLGEYHRIVIEQAASITVPLPNTGQVIRLPLKVTNRPKDEVELSERESALLEKERQLEVLKATVEAEKRELDEALEVEKIHREERDRDNRRLGTEMKLREESRQAEAKREREQLDAISLQIKLMREEALKEQGEIAKEKLELAAERARLEATYSMQVRSEGSIPPLDIIQARTEVEAALETARQAKEAAEQERRRQAEMRQAVEEISWEQKEMDQRLENREKHLTSMMKSAEKLRSEGLAALDEAKALKEKLEEQQKDMKEQLRQIETKERVLAKERLEIAKEKIELEKRRAQLEMILPELTAAEELTLNPPKAFVDPKAVIMRLKAEKELESFITTQKF